MKALSGKTAQLAFFALLEQNKLPQPTPEFKFLKDRKFLFDYAWDYPFKIALEVEGGIWMRKGAHNTGTAILRDIEKYNLAVIHGWVVLRTTPDKLCTIETIKLLQSCFFMRMDQVKAMNAIRLVNEKTKAWIDELLLDETVVQNHLNGFIRRLNYKMIRLKLKCTFEIERVIFQEINDDFTQSMTMVIYKIIKVNKK